MDICGRTFATIRSTRAALGIVFSAEAGVSPRSYAEMMFTRCHAESAPSF